MGSLFVHQPASLSDSARKRQSLPFELPLRFVFWRELLNLIEKNFHAGVLGIKK